MRKLQLEYEIEDALNKRLDPSLQDFNPDNIIYQLDGEPVNNLNVKGIECSSACFNEMLDTILTQNRA